MEPMVIFTHENKLETPNEVGVKMMDICRQAICSRHDKSSYTPNN